MANSIEQANVPEDSLIRTHLVHCHGGPRDIIAEIICCCDFAAKKHKNQRRKDEEETPYIDHPIGEIKFKSYDNNRGKLHKWQDS